MKNALIIVIVVLVIVLVGFAGAVAFIMISLYNSISSIPEDTSNYSANSSAYKTIFEVEIK
jgi:flagellar basal body-associated protein FliL